MKLRRGRTSAIPLKPYPTIQIVDKAVDFETYSDMLDQQYITIRDRTIRRANTPLAKPLNQVVAALLCGRIGAQNNADDKLFERTKNCRVTRLCPVCRIRRDRARAAELVKDFRKNHGLKLVSFLFTLPAPTSHEEELEYLDLSVNKVIPALRDALTAWSRRSPAVKHLTGSYVIGVHVKQSDNRLFLGSHVHAMVFLHHRCPLKTRSTGIYHYLREAFAHAVDISPIPYCDARNRGRFKKSETTETVRTAKHRPATCKIARAVNSFAYVMRTTENDDTDDIRYRRDTMFDTLNIRSSYTSSRSRTSEDINMAHEFAADRLGKNAYVFPFGEAPCEITPNEYQQTIKSLKQEAERLVRSWSCP